MRHVIDLCQEGLYRPDIATLDCGSLNFGDGNRAYVSTPNYLRRGMQIARDSASSRNWRCLTPATSGSSSNA